MKRFSDLRNFVILHWLANCLIVQCIF
uniref:Uncharacterized protein n=1 Tax=Rhizophora mucronata TaxID=61149 RepID=A0A2P2P615_RHIMU